MASCDKSSCSGSPPSCQFGRRIDGLTEEDDAALKLEEKKRVGPAPQTSNRQASRLSSPASVMEAIEVGPTHVGARLLFFFFNAGGCNARA